MPIGLVGFDKRELGSAPCLVGVDEAGRGCLAGPVVAAAVRCERQFYSTSWCRRNSRGVDDSKRLSPAKRAKIVTRFSYACRQNWIQIGIGVAGVEEIDRFNIYHATTLAMRRALENVVNDHGTLWESPQESCDSHRVLIDGRPIRSMATPHKGIVKGDQKSLAIALAGIHAKEYRDELMRELDGLHPDYGFSVHKGYGTSIHLAALRTHGPSMVHRRSFLGKILPCEPGLVESMQDSLF